MHRKAPVFNNSRPLTPVFSRQIPYSFVFFVLVVFNSNTWLNWVSAFYASEALAPEIETALEMISVISATWYWLMPSSLAF